MKNGFLVGLAIILALVMCMGSALAEPVRTETAARHKITVDGSAAVKVKPDVAYVDLGVQTESKEAKDAQTENAKLMNDVLAAIKALGIADEDVQTTGFSVSPKYNYGRQTTIGYIVTNGVVVTLKDMDQVSAVVDAAVAAGANSTSISFAVSDPSPVYQQALQNALADAKGKAMALTEAAGAILVDMPIEMNVQNTYQSYARSMVFEDVAYDSGYGDSTPIQSGNIDISAAVQVVYEYAAEDYTYGVEDTEP